MNKTLHEKTGRYDLACLEPVVEKLVEATDPDAILLFGSRARGDHNEDSDFDIYVLVPETRPFGGKSPYWLWDLVREMGVPIDVLMRQTALFERRRASVNSIENSVSKDAVVLYERLARR